MLRKRLGLFAARLPIECERFPGELVISSINLTGTEVCSIKKNLKTSGRFSVRLIRCLLSVLFSRCRWQNATRYQDGDNCKTKQNLHIVTKRAFTVPRL